MLGFIIVRYDYKRIAAPVVVGLIEAVLAVDAVSVVVTGALAVVPDCSTDIVAVPAVLFTTTHTYIPASKILHFNAACSL